jgi:DNA helicase-2/ATP-dependent DNA helicase PcrA
LAGYVAASIMEWPGLACDDAILKTLRAITDFYRVKLSSGTAGSRDKIQTIERAITAFGDGKTIHVKIVKLIITAFDNGIDLAREPVGDRQAAGAQCSARNTSSSRVRGWNAPVISLGSGALLVKTL